MIICLGGGIGIRTGLKILGQQWIEGSSPSPGTNKKHTSIEVCFLFYLPLCICHKKGYGVKFNQLLFYPMSTEHRDYQPKEEQESEHLKIKESVNGVDYQISWIDRDDDYEIYFPQLGPDNQIIRLSDDAEEANTASERIKSMAEEGMDAEEIHAKLTEERSNDFMEMLNSKSF